MSFATSVGASFDVNLPTNCNLLSFVSRKIVSVPVLFDQRIVNDLEEIETQWLLIGKSSHIGKWSREFRWLG